MIFLCNLRFGLHEHVDMLQAFNFRFKFGCAGLIAVCSLILLVFQIHLLFDLLFEVVQNRKLVLQCDIFLAHLHSQMLVQTLQITALDL